MIAEHILGNIRDGVTENVVNIPFEWFETEKKRIAKTAEDGTEFGVCVGSTMRSSPSASASRFTRAIFLHGKTARCMRCASRRRI